MQEGLATQRVDLLDSVSNTNSGFVIKLYVQQYSPREMQDTCRELEEIHADELKCLVNGICVCDLSRVSPTTGEHPAIPP